VQARPRGSRQEVTCLPGMAAGPPGARCGPEGALQDLENPPVGPWTGLRGQHWFSKWGWAALGDNPRSEKGPVLTGAAGAA
jgi:hypothetical protein